jgi:hypothetical protein
LNDPLGIVDGDKIELHKLDIEFENIDDILCFEDTLYVASDDGLTYLPISNLSAKETIPPKPFIEMVTVDDETIEHSDIITTKGDMNKLVIEFYSLNYSTLSTIYSYKLDGYDKDWTEGVETRASYTNLPPGNYNFRVVARKTGEDKTLETSLRIIVKPTLFQMTITWIVLAIIFLSVVVLAIIVFKNSQIKKRERESLLLNLENKALQSMMNPHFIFNSLGSIQNYLYQNKAVEAGTYLSQFARLIRQNMNSIKTNNVFLGEEIERIHNYLDLEKLRMDNRFDYSIEYDENLDIEDLSIPSMVVQPFVENAVWHGISSLSAEGFIRVIFKNIDSKRIKIVVEDNGVGTKHSKLHYSKEDHLQMGMKLTDKRLKLIGEKYHVRTSIHIESINPGQLLPGTRVEVVVPVTSHIFDPISDPLQKPDNK